MKSATLNVEGMHCAGCAAIVRSRISTLTGVATAEVSFDTRQARVLYDPQEVDELQIAEVVRKLGYRVVESSVS